MIAKSISTSKKLAKVSNFEALLFTWLIPHCDDYGHMDALPQIVKGVVIPLRIEGIEEVKNALEVLDKVKLIARYIVEDDEYLEIINWEEHQTFRADRPRIARFPMRPGQVADSGMSNDNQRENFDDEKSTQGKVSEGKVSEGKVRERARPEASIEYLNKIPLEDMKGFVSRFIATEKQVKSKAEDLRLYCEKKGRVYKNYKSFLLNALKNDFKERDENKASKYL